MNPGSTNPITPTHRKRKAIVYVRQSTRNQVEQHTGSTTHQRGQVEHALALGWRPEDIEVIDEDLGLSGTSADRRAGFKRLRCLVAQEQVGIILISDTSRLTRSSKDCESLLDLCRDTGTLLAIDGALVDLQNPEDLLLARIRGNLAQFDNEKRTREFMKTKRTLAANGHAVSAPPTGYMLAEKGKWVKDLDPIVRHRIMQVFEEYQRRGSLGQVLHFFNEHGLKLPIRKGLREVRWVAPTRSRVAEILGNPAYVGHYVFCRRPRKRAATKGERRRRTDREKWLVFENHHEPYVSPEVQQQIIRQLEDRRVTIRQPVGQGPALVQGIIWCGRCGNKMGTHYNPAVNGRRASYRCDSANIARMEPLCWRVLGRSVDAVVEAELFGYLQPPELEAVLETAKEANGAYDAACKEREMELGRARYEAQLAERRYKTVDPDNVLVTACLQKDWEQALERVRKIERHHREVPLKAPLEMTTEVLQAIRDLATDIPALWKASSTTNQDRKTLVRRFITKICVVSISQLTFEIDITWVGGAVSHHSIFQHGAPGIIARKLHAQGLSNTEIAAELNRQGLKTFYYHRPYTRRVVQSLLRWKPGVGIVRRGNERRSGRHRTPRRCESLPTSGASGNFVVADASTADNRAG